MKSPYVRKHVEHTCGTALPLVQILTQPVETHIQHPLSYPELGHTSAPISYVLMSCISFRFSYIFLHDSSGFHHVVVRIFATCMFLLSDPHWLVIQPCMPVTLKSHF